MPVARDRPLRLAVAAGLLWLAAVAIARQGEVLARGRLLPFFDSYEVTRVRVLGIELYVDVSAGAGDALTATALVLAGAVLLHGSFATAGRASRAFRRAGLGALFLAADDLLSAHETIGHNLPVLAGIPLLDHPDDAIVAVYAAAALAFAWRERALLEGAPRGPWWLAGAAAALAVVHDVSPLHLGALEEGLEVLAAGAALVAVVTLARHHARRADPAAARPAAPKRLGARRRLSWRG